MTNKQHGFTIVELLIVIVVIGILAAIVIVAYNGVTNRANDNAVKSDLANLAKKIEAYKAVSSTALYPTTMTEFYSMDGGVKLSKSAYNTTPSSSDFNALVCLKSGDSYVIMSASKSTNRFYISSTTNTPTSTTQTFGGADTTCVALGVNPPASTNRGWMYNGGSWDTNVR